MGTFADTVARFKLETEKQITAVWRGSIDMLADEMTTTRANGGRLPIMTGNLRRSLLGSTSAPPTQGGPDARYSGGDVGALTAGLTTDQTVWLGFQAAYAHRQNYGFVGEDSLGRSYNQSGAGFIEGAVALWPTIVELVAESVKSKAGI